MKFSLRVTRMNQIRNDYRGTAQAEMDIDRGGIVEMLKLPGRSYRV